MWHIIINFGSGNQTGYALFDSENEKDIFLIYENQKYSFNKKTRKFNGINEYVSNAITYRYEK